MSEPRQVDATEFCPATMCPLFALDGSPWTGEQNAPCEHEGCGWFDGGRCQGGVASYEQVAEVEMFGGAMQLGPNARRRSDQRTPRTYDCPRAHECRWQIEAGDELCPPRYALARGIDPRTCAY